MACLFIARSSRLRPRNGECASDRPLARLQAGIMEVTTWILIDQGRWRPSPTLGSSHQEFARRLLIVCKAETTCDRPAAHRFRASGGDGRDASAADGFRVMTR
jgi:hypothetical protein